MKRIGIYAGKNLLRIILLLFAVSILTFALVSASPIDPLQANVGQAALGSMSEEQKEKLYEAKLNFFANITHELCTPLTLINGVNDYIKTSADRLADGKLEKYARILGENVTSLNELIQEILDLRKIEEAGFSQIHIKRVSVSGLIRKQCESFMPVAEQNGINFTFNEAGKPVYWNTDVPSLKKIIRNLVSNAFKYTEQKGTIDVSVRIENDSLIIKIYNTGKGIAEADLKTIFDRFHILGDLDGNNYTRMTSRNGLGLFICHSMAQLLRGEIKVESKEGEFGWTSRRRGAGCTTGGFGNDCRNRGEYR